MKTKTHKPLTARLVAKTGRVLFAGLILISPMPASAQPEFEHQHTYSASICRLEKSGDKYFAMDNINNRCLLYNMDHTEFRTVSLTLPQDYYMYNIQHVSQHTFNQDDLIELAYTCSKYNLLESSYYYSYETRIISENGTEILKIPGAGHTEVFETENEGRKLLVYIYDFSVLPATTQTRVYSLPDGPLKSGPVQSRRGLENPYPNPSGGIVNIPVKLPPGVEEGELVFYNLYGQEVYRQAVKQEEDLIIMPGGMLIPGIYVYKMQNGEQESQGKKLIIR